ncbi:hypothetical protein BDP27DRAFT_1337944 [Rhodocollybia butyracea]|uniref:Uncharacterized protein n=1 Tax=Rhodocollybia butyracea TaxID=206335 RepID=A0A9P5U0M1_9AGAR|nr:hypothetical protein BDP27DRAFT_1337944 [Rhodocollybia butyracea]
MSSTVSGTNSPPLEATGEDKPMGASSIESAQKGEQVKAVPDSEQRKQYFQPTELEDSVCFSSFTCSYDPFLPILLPFSFHFPFLRFPVALLASPLPT